MDERVHYRGQRIRTNLAFSAFLLGAAILAAHLFFLQFERQVRAFYVAKVAQYWHSYECPQGKRGNIYFRDGSLLAGNQKVARVVAEPTLMPEEHRLNECTQLSQWLALPADEIQKKIDAAGMRHGIVLAEDVPVDTALAIDRAGLRGIFTKYYYARIYPQKELGAAASVGYAGKQPMLRLGLEAKFDPILTGADGKVVFRKDARRKRLPGSVLDEKPKRDGQSVTTTLDPAIQIICEDELRRAVAGVNAQWGCVLVLDPHDGEVLGAATAPTFDPNEYARGNIGSEMNVLTQRVFEPGSTAKPVLAAYALDRGWIDPTERYICNRLLTINSYTVREAEASHVIGDNNGVPIGDIITKSSNIGMARVALELGQDRVLDGYSAMGFFQRTGIELPTEAKGFRPCWSEEKRLKHKVTWPRITLATSGFGQGLAVTPVQLAAAYCIIANGGYAVKPTLIMPQDAGEPAPQDVTDAPTPPPGETLISLAKDAPAAVKSLLSGNQAQAAENDAQHNGQVRVLSQQTCNEVTQWLVNVIEKGTGKKAKLGRCLAAGKTGTAQVASRYGGYLRGAYTASFCGFFPAQAPRYLVLVVIGQPRGKYYGGEVAAPVFKAVGDRISYMDNLLVLEAAHASR
jgi:cell division protein FtsI/penicillin-binding protein 2